MFRYGSISSSLLVNEAWNILLTPASCTRFVFSSCIHHSENFKPCSYFTWFFSYLEETWCRCTYISIVCVCLNVYTSLFHDKHLRNRNYQHLYLTHTRYFKYTSHFVSSARVSCKNSFPGGQNWRLVAQGANNTDLCHTNTISSLTDKQQNINQFTNKSPNYPTTYD